MNSRVPINYLKSIEHIVQIYNYSIKTQTFDIPTKNVIAPKKKCKTSVITFLGIHQDNQQMFFLPTDHSKVDFK